MKKTIMQYFEWYLPSDGKLWKQLKNDAEHLKRIGITDVWLPPAYKGAGGKEDTGYGVYDLYDLGEFDQKGSVSTKYGLKDEYIEAIECLHSNKVNVLADVVFNHKMGADELEDVIATEELNTDRNVSVNQPITIKAWTKYTFPGRNGKYSNFIWNWSHFHGVDWDENAKKSGIYRFYGKHWDLNVDDENGNYDYLMGADVDLNNVDVVNELYAWTRWYLELTNVDGFRLDATKHIRADFYKQWAKTIQDETMKKIFFIGEYWKNDIYKLKEYIEETDHNISIFDVPLHYHFYQASMLNEKYNMRYILEDTLMNECPHNAVTFVDNHDTEPGQALESYVKDWFKPIAYAIILLRAEGIPCVFYGDYYGIRRGSFTPIPQIIDLFLNVRNRYCYGSKNDYFDHDNVIGWTYEGDYEHINSGVAILLSNGQDGWKNMHIGMNFKECEMFDITGNIKETIKVDSLGNADFKCNGRSVSIWVKKII